MINKKTSMDKIGYIFRGKKLQRKCRKMEIVYIKSGRNDLEEAFKVI